MQDRANLLLTEFTENYLRKKAKQLVHRVGYTASDVEDIQQDLLVHLLERIDQFDPERGHINVFITAVTERYIANILRDREADCRRPENPVESLNVSVACEDSESGSVDFGETVDEERRTARDDHYPRSEIESFEMREDIAAVVSKLPHQLQELCERLMYDPVSKVANDMQVPRTTINRWLEELAEYFDQAGLKGYCRPIDESAEDEEDETDYESKDAA